MKKEIRTKFKKLGVLIVYLFGSKVIGMITPLNDTYTCPAENSLKRKSLHASRQSIDYESPKKTCAAYGLREQCTRNKSGRTVKRHLRQAELEIMREATMTAASRQDIKTRQHLI